MIISGPGLSSLAIMNKQTNNYMPAYYFQKVFLEITEINYTDSINLYKNENQ